MQLRALAQAPLPEPDQVSKGGPYCLRPTKWQDSEALKEETY
jgi:hypothetical protein